MNAMTQAETGAYRAAADVAQLTAIVSMALAVEGDVQLQKLLRQAARTPADQALILQLPGAPAALAIDPGGGLRPIRTTQTTAGVGLEALAPEHSGLQQRVSDAVARTRPVAQTLFEPFFVPGALPSRAEFDAVFRWAPLIEGPAYRSVALAASRLDEWRASALRQATNGAAIGGAAAPESVLSFYFALSHTMAHLTLLGADPGARPWLAGMAGSFAWTNWTPSFPLVRERTMWLAAAAAKSAAAFGPDVVDGYLQAMIDTRHVYKMFDALFGLTAIALSDDQLLGPLTDLITAAQDACVSRVTAGAAQAPWLFRSAISLLQRWPDDRSADSAALRQLGWGAGDGSGLATRQAFRLDPSQIDARGQVLGFGALPAIMQASAARHYPRSSTRPSALLPQRHELADILTRAWGAGQKVAQTIH